MVLWGWPLEMEMEVLKCAVFLSALFSVGGENDTSSGPQSLPLHTPPPPPLASCLTRGQCLHGTEDIEATVNSVENYLDCLILCRFWQLKMHLYYSLRPYPHRIRSSPSCEWFTHLPGSGECRLHSKCLGIDASAKSAVSGQHTCPLPGSR